METTQESLITLPALARVLHLPAPWLRAEADAGRIPCLRVGRKRLFKRSAVERVLGHRAESGEAPRG